MKLPIRLVTDTNVFISAVFFAGTPYAILDAWRRKKVELIVSRAMLDEYQETGEKLSRQFPGVDVAPWLVLLEQYAVMVEPSPLPHQVCTDPDDDLFLACACAAGAKLICSGDKALLRTSGYCGIEVLKPREFVTRYL